MIGYYLLVIFLTYKYDLNYIPKQLTSETDRFFLKDYVHLPKLFNLL